MALQRRFDVVISGLYPNKVVTITNNETGSITVIEQRNLNLVEGIHIPAQQDPTNAAQRTPESRQRFRSADGSTDGYTINSRTEIVFHFKEGGQITDYKLELQHVDNNASWNGGDASDVAQFLADLLETNATATIATGVNTSETITAGKSVISISVVSGTVTLNIDGAGAETLTSRDYIFNAPSPGATLPEMVVDATGGVVEIMTVE